MSKSKVRKFSGLLFSALIVFGLGLALPPEKVISWQQAPEYVGQTVTVEGLIVATHNSGQACFLNFNPDYRNNLSLVIFASNFSQFPPQPEKYYLNKKVRARGRIVTYKGRLEIILSSSRQIQLMDLGGSSVISPRTITEGQSSTSGARNTGSGHRVSTQSGNNESADKVIKEISWEEAADYYGQTVWVRGKVIAANNTGKACFLNFHRNWKRYFTVVIFASSFDRFPNPPESYYLNKEIRVYGQIRDYQGKPEIIVEGPEQIKIIE